MKINKLWTKKFYKIGFWSRWKIISNINKQLYAIRKKMSFDNIASTWHKQGSFAEKSGRPGQAGGLTRQFTRVLQRPLSEPTFTTRQVCAPFTHTLK